MNNDNDRNRNGNSIDLRIHRRSCGNAWMGMAEDAEGASKICEKE